MTSINYTDLSGIFHVQQQYLADLNALASNSSSTTDAIDYMKDLNSKLSNAYTAYASVNPGAIAVLSNQTEMKNIIDKEAARLEAKKQSVESALYGQKRMAHFSNSYSKKYYAQIKILLIIIIVVLIYLALTFLNSLIPISDNIILIIMIIVCLIAFVIIISTILDISSRYNMDFDKLNLSAPSTIKISGNLDGNISSGNGGLICIGESCCPANNSYGSVWDSDKQKCLSINSITGGKQPFTLMSEAYTTDKPSSSSNQALPFEPSEINSYTKI